MESIVFHIFFLIISLYILFKAIGFGVYEFNVQKNKSGGVIVISFSTFVVIFTNIMVWIN